MTDTVTTVMWFRRDLRLSDNQALVEAVRNGDRVLPLFVVDDALWGPSGDNRRAFLVGALRALDESLGGRLVVRHGDPVRVVPDVARDVGAPWVFVAEDFGPYGRARDERVARALVDRADAAMTLVGSPYAVAPGEVVTKQGTPYKVFTPFSRAWLEHGWPGPVAAPRSPTWAAGVASDGILDAPKVDAHLPEPGEAAAKQAARRFWDHHVDDYAEQRNRPDLDATSRLSPYLKWGCIHPRQLLAKLDARSKSHRVFRNELCWREFYADVLYAVPDSARRALVPGMQKMQLDSGREADERFSAWAEGRTGFPFVDAGMRQLLTEGWVHNRVRMMVASFLVKDLHLDWTRGARHFLRHLVDGDLASNNHGWQWVAGTGTDAAQYIRVFNPVTQSERFDPDGDYIRRYVEELRDVPAPAIHQPWTLPEGPPNGYPTPIVDHAAERKEALRRFDALA